jgi:hypothetical protein
MASSCFQNEKAPCRGFLTLAHAGDPTPVIWIANTLHRLRNKAMLFSPPKQTFTELHDFQPATC